MTTTEQTVDADIVDQSAGLLSGTPAHQARLHRDKVTSATQGSHDAVFDPALVELTLTERLLAALYTSVLTPSPALARHYGERLREVVDIDAAVLAAVHAKQHAQIGDARLRAILAFTHVLATRPIDSDHEALRALEQAGLSTSAIVALGQLIAFLSYQLRVVAGVKGLAELAPALTADGAIPDAAAAADPLTLARPLLINGYTDRPLTWHAWLDTVALEHATPEQVAVLDVAHPKAKTSDYYLLLVHQPEILRQRQIAFNAIMYAPGGLPRAERELSATVVSRVNGCVYCASVHAERFEQLAKRNDVIAQLFADPHTAGVTAREKAIVQFSIALTGHPDRIAPATYADLKAQGLGAVEILDLIHAVAVFAWANRLMLSLGALGEPPQA